MDSYLRMRLASSLATADTSKRKQRVGDRMVRFQEQKIFAVETDGSNYDTARERAAHDRLGAFISVIDVPSNLGGDEHRGVLSNVAFAVKDNIDTQDLPTTGGTEALRYSQPLRDAEAVRRLTVAGARLIGKTNLHELAFGITGNNGSFGAVRNPYDPDRSAGGSSSGSAVAVAVGIVPFALGTDTGGSIRIPAAHCGVVGMRPSTGRYPAAGVIRLSSTRDTIGVIAATVPQVALVDTALTGQTEYTTSELTGIRLGWPTDGFLDDVDQEILGAMVRVRSVLEAAGADFVNVSTRLLQELDAQCGFPITFYESSREIVSYVNGLSDPYRGLSLADIAAVSLSPDVKAILSQIVDDPVADLTYAEALLRRSALQTAYATVFSDHKIAALLYPTVVVLPPLLDETETMLLNNRTVPVFDTTIRNTSPGSVAGTPSISIPAGRSSTGLPIGLSVEGAIGDDRALLGITGAISMALSRAEI